jgi:hypothetical protein
MHRSVLKSAFLLLLACLLAGCSPSPRSVAVEFMTELSKGNVTRAKALATPQAAQMIDMSASLGALPSGPFEFVSEEILSDSKARVTLRNGNGKTEKVDLVKIDGDWKVALSK